MNLKNHRLLNETKTLCLIFGIVLLYLSTLIIDKNFTIRNRPTDTQLAVPTHAPLAQPLPLNGRPSTQPAVRLARPLQNRFLSAVQHQSAAESAAFPLPTTAAADEVVSQLSPTNPQVRICFTFFNIGH